MNEHALKWFLGLHNLIENSFVFKQTNVCTTVFPGVHYLQIDDSKLTGFVVSNL